MSEEVPEGDVGRLTLPEEPIRVMVVDDHPVWRDGIRNDLSPPVSPQWSPRPRMEGRRSSEPANRCRRSS